MNEYIKKTSIIGLAHKLAFGRILTDREVEVVEMVVNDAPAADVAPVRHGRWIRNSPTAWIWTCSCCQKADVYAYSVGDSLEPVLQDLFCPNCGAKMDGGVEDE